MTKFAWVVEIDLAEDLVADGFQITERVMMDLLATALPFVRTGAIRARVLASPDADAVAHAQGFASAANKAAGEAKEPVRAGKEPTTARLHRR